MTTSPAPAFDSATPSRPRTALVTGASRGLGRSAARHLAAAGTAVIGTYRERSDEAARLVDELRRRGVAAEALHLDLGEPDTFPAFAREVRAVLDRLGVPALDHLVNNAGDGWNEPYATTGRDRFDDLVRVQLGGPYFLTQALLPVLADGGSVLNVSTGLTRFTVPGYSAYAAAKGAVEVLTRYQAAELAPRGIRVNVLAPGAVATDFAGGAVRDVPEVGAATAATVALGRVGRPDDIGAAVPHLLADGMGWVTGTRIEVSGGQRL